MLRKTKIATALSQLKPLKVCVSAPQKSLAKSRHLLPLGALMTGMCGLAWAEPADTTKDQVMSTVNVTATQEKEQDGYKATQTRVGRTLQDPHDIPQAVTTVTNKLMEEQQVGSLKEALRNVSGLTFNAAEGGRSGDNMMLRGFYTFGDIYLDGTRDTAQYNRETFNLEQVDVLRGAAAMLFGRGQAGGVINQVSKTPFTTDKSKLTASVGTDNYYEVTGDINKRLADNTAVRVNFFQRDEGSWRSNPATGTEPELHRKGVAASLGFGLGTADELLLSHVRTFTNDIPDFGVSFDTNTRAPQGNFPVSNFWGIDRNFDKSDTSITTATYTKKLAPETEWRTQLRYADYERSYWARTPSATIAPGTTGLNLPCTNGTCVGPTRGMDYETLNLQSDYSTKFNLNGMKHELLSGVEFFREDSFRNNLQNLGGITALNPPIIQPYITSFTTTPALPAPTGPTDPVRFKSNSYAVFVQDTVEFVPHWKATLGVRRDYMDAKYSSATSPQLKYGEWSTRAALSWQPVEDTHYYVSYSDSFSPTADLYQLTVAPLPPERSQVLEVGAKWMLYDGDLVLRTALYRANKDWERNTDLESTSTILTKKRRTDGFEVEVAGRVTEDWEVFAGLSLMNSRILEVAENVNATTGVITAANAGYKGVRSRNTPPYTFNLWTTYAMGGGWKIGGGVEAKGKRYGYNPSGAGAVPTLPGSTDFHPNTAPAYERWDAMVSYEQRSYTVRLNIRNVFDRVYYDAIYDIGGFTVPGQRRAAIVTTEWKF